MGIVPLFSNSYYVTFPFSCDVVSVWYDVNECSIITNKNCKPKSGKDKDSPETNGNIVTVTKHTDLYRSVLPPFQVRCKSVLGPL